MFKMLMSFIVGAIFIGAIGWNVMPDLMLREVESPYSVEETAARIQRNIQTLSANGWSLSGLRNPARAVAKSGVNVPPTLLIEACSTKYSAPMLKDDASRILSILMPCTITVYKKDNGKTYIGLMNSGLMGEMFGVGDVMWKVARDQAEFIKFDPTKPAPPLIKVRKGGGGAGGKADDGC